MALYRSPLTATLWPSLAKRDGSRHEKDAPKRGEGGQQEEAKPTRTRRGWSQTRNWEKQAFIARSQESGATVSSATDRFTLSPFQLILFLRTGHFTSLLSIINANCSAHFYYIF
ncbi:hypothetical protein TNCV_421441 [Trichonephila clavipes]|nr:hypothetical protein TNCV_421441 [Trichonephila clavipes]